MTYQIFPKRWEKTYLHWLENIRDWHQSTTLVGTSNTGLYRKGEPRSDSVNWFVGINPPDDIENWEQDEDVLDTWAHHGFGLNDTRLAKEKP